MAASSAPAAATWQSQLAAYLGRYKRFPPQAQRRGEQGEVLMHITLSRHGDVLAMSMARSSGYADLDAEAEAWIRRATPLLPIPPDIPGDPVTIMVPLRFMLR